MIAQLDKRQNDANNGPAILNGSNMLLNCSPAGGSSGVCALCGGDDVEGLAQAQLQAGLRGVPGGSLKALNSEDKGLGRGGAVGVSADAVVGGVSVDAAAARARVQLLAQRGQRGLIDKAHEERTVVGVIGGARQQ